MQQSKDLHTADPYLTWQDLLAEELEGDAQENIAQSPPSVSGADHWPTTAQVKLPPDVTALLEEKERLEDELKRLAGLGEPRPEDERVKRMYPVKVHTKESRIEDRRLRQHDERQHMLKQRAREAKLAQAREEQRQAELAAESRRKTIERTLARVRAQLHEAELAAEQRRKAIERTQATLRQQQRKAEHAAERQRKEIEQALIEERWASDRQKALIKGAQERRQAALAQAEDLNNQRTQVRELAQVRKEQAQAALQKEQVQQARLDEAKRSARLEKQPDEWEKAPDVPDQPAARLRLDALQQLYQKKRQTRAWEQERERLRENALQRRREEKTLADRLDRRGKHGDRFASTA